MDSLSPFQPGSPAIDAWNAAYERVGDYLRAHRIPSRLHRRRLADLILERAVRRRESEPGADPVALAVEEADALMTDWFSRALGRRADSFPERLQAEGRLALLLCGGAERWPYATFTPDPLPEEFSRAMRRSAVQAGPDMVVSSMVPRPIELGALHDAAGGTLETLERWPVLRTLILWGLFAGTLALIFTITR